MHACADELSGHACMHEERKAAGVGARAHMVNLVVGELGCIVLDCVGQRGLLAQLVSGGARTAQQRVIQALDSGPGVLRSYSVEPYLKFLLQLI